MKLLIPFCAWVLSSSAFACPDFSGKWDCKNSDGSETISTVTLSQISGGVNYHIVNASGQTLDYPADGAQHTYSENGMNGTMTVSCQGDTVVAGTMNMAGNGVTANENFSYTYVSGAALTGTVDATVDFTGHPAQHSTITSSCTKSSE